MIDVLARLDEGEDPLDIDRLIFQNSQLSDRLDEDDEFLRGVTKLGDFLGYIPRGINEATEADLGSGESY